MNIFLTLFQLGAQAEISAGATYFNERVSEWEPLLEPVEEKGYRAWELSVQVPSPLPGDLASFQCCCGSSRRDYQLPTGESEPSGRNEDRTRAKRAF